MPTYTYECGTCGTKVDSVRKISDRSRRFGCACGGVMSRVPELFRAQTFEPYYDEGAGRDFYSASERRAWMKERGVQEAGDPVGGARNFDANAPSLIGKSAPRGDRPQASRAELEDRRDNMVLETVDREGRTVSRARYGDLGSIEDVRWHHRKGDVTQGGSSDE